MGAAKRVEDHRQSWLESGRKTEPEVELGFTEWMPEEETDPWCVDDGASIVVMCSRDIRQRLRGGALRGDEKVWRDGRACWLPVEEVYELRTPDEDTAPSRIRRVRRRPDSSERGTQIWGTEQGWWRRTLLMIFGGITLGTIAMALLGSTAAPGVNKLEPSGLAFADRW